MVFSSLAELDMKFPVHALWMESFSDEKFQSTQTSPQGWGLRDEEIQQMGEEQVEMLAPNPRQDFWDR